MRYFFTVILLLLAATFSFNNQLNAEENSIQNEPDLVDTSTSEATHQTIYGDDNETVVTCREIFETSSYRKRDGFTRVPTLGGCHVGQVVGGVLGAPFMLFYAPTCAAADRGNCDSYKTPIEDGSELFGRIIGYTLGAPFFLLETIFTGDDD